MADYKYFSKDEMKCRHCGKEGMDEDFMVKLIEAREKAGTPFIITSGFRCKEYDDTIRGDGNHPQGKAADIKAINGWTRFKIMQALLAVGFQRLGISKEFIHVDDCYDKPRPCIWLYDEKEGD